MRVLVFHFNILNSPECEFSDIPRDRKSVISTTTNKDILVFTAWVVLGDEEGLFHLLPRPLSSKFAPRDCFKTCLIYTKNMYLYILGYTYGCPWSTRAVHPVVHVLKTKRFTKHSVVVLLWRTYLGVRLHAPIIGILYSTGNHHLV